MDDCYYRKLICLSVLHRFSFFLDRRLSLHLFYRHRHSSFLIGLLLPGVLYPSKIQTIPVLYNQHTTRLEVSAECRRSFFRWCQSSPSPEPCHRETEYSRVLEYSLNRVVYSLLHIVHCITLYSRQTIDLRGSSSDETDDWIDRFACHRLRLGFQSTDVQH
jgi:hypothetical protein